VDCRDESYLFERLRRCMWDEILPSPIFSLHLPQRGFAVSLLLMMFVVSACAVP